jgi:hypothetical protein
MKYAAYKLTDGRIIHPKCADELYRSDKLKKKQFAGIESAIVDTGDERNPLLSRFQLCAHCNTAI